MWGRFTRISRAEPGAGADRGRLPVPTPTMPPHSDPHHLLHGPYTPPPLRRGDKAICLFRDAEVIVTGWSDAPISWPRCRS